MKEHDGDEIFRLHEHLSVMDLRLLCVFVLQKTVVKIEEKVPNSW